MSERVYVWVRIRGGNDIFDCADIFDRTEA